MIYYIIFHLLCAVISAGIGFAMAQGEFKVIAKEKYREDLGFAWLYSLTFGPLALLIFFFLSGFCKYGIKWK